MDHLRDDVVVCKANVDELQVTCNQTFEGKNYTWQGFEKALYVGDDELISTSLWSICGINVELEVGHMKPKDSSGVWIVKSQCVDLSITRNSNKRGVGSRTHDTTVNLNFTKRH